MNTRIGALVLFILAAAVTGCGGGGTTNPAPPSSPTPVPAQIVISLNQTDVTLDVSNQFTFVANVMGTTNKAVSWVIQEGMSGGRITSSGVYTAPGTNGVFHVIATSQADTSQKATATVTVTTLMVSISPPSNLLGPVGVRDFSATVNTSLNTSVNWSVQEAAGGSVTMTGGQYTAPSTTGGPFHVVATSVQDPTHWEYEYGSLGAHGHSPAEWKSADRRRGLLLFRWFLLRSLSTVVRGALRCRRRHICDYRENVGDACFPYRHTAQ